MASRVNFWLLQKQENFVEGFGQETYDSAQLSNDLVFYVAVG